MPAHWNETAATSPTIDLPAARVRLTRCALRTRQGVGDWACLLGRGGRGVGLTTCGRPIRRFRSAAGHGLGSGGIPGQASPSRRGGVSRHNSQGWSCFEWLTRVAINIVAAIPAQSALSLAAIAKALFLRMPTVSSTTNEPRATVRIRLSQNERGLRMVARLSVHRGLANPPPVAAGSSMRNSVRP